MLLVGALHDRDMGLPEALGRHAVLGQRHPLTRRHVQHAKNAGRVAIHAVLAVRVADHQRIHGARDIGDRQQRLELAREDPTVPGLRNSRERMPKKSTASTSLAASASQNGHGEATAQLAEGIVPVTAVELVDQQPVVFGRVGGAFACALVSSALFSITPSRASERPVELLVSLLERWQTPRWTSGAGCQISNHAPRCARRCAIASSSCRSAAPRIPKIAVIPARSVALPAWSATDLWHVSARLVIRNASPQSHCTTSAGQPNPAARHAGRRHRRHPHPLSVPRRSLGDLHPPGHGLERYRHPEAPETSIIRGARARESLTWIRRTPTHTPPMRRSDQTATTAHGCAATTGHRLCSIHPARLAGSKVDV